MDRLAPEIDQRPVTRWLCPGCQAPLDAIGVVAFSARRMPGGRYVIGAQRFDASGERIATEWIIHACPPPDGRLAHNGQS